MQKSKNMTYMRKRRAGRGGKICDHEYLTGKNRQLSEVGRRSGVEEEGSNFKKSERGRSRGGNRWLDSPKDKQRGKGYRSSKGISVRGNAEGQSCSLETRKKGRK